MSGNALTRACPLRILKNNTLTGQKEKTGTFMKKHHWPVLTAGCLAAAALAFACSQLSAETIHAYLAEMGPWAPAGYIALFTLLPAVFFPVAVLALAGGLLFGLFWGSVYTFLGALLNCTLMFLLSRYAGRDRLDRYVRQKLPLVWQDRLRQAGGRRGFFLLVLLRLIPAVPYNLINYAFGLTSMGFPQYILASAIGIIPGTLVFINIGDKTLDPSAPSFWIAVGLLVLLLAATALLGRRLFPRITENGEEM